MKKLSVVKKIKVWMLVLALITTSTLMYGCKGAREEETNAVVEKNTTKGNMENETSSEKKTTEGESHVEDQTSSDEKTEDTKETSGEESGESTKNEQQSSEESTTPMDGTTSSSDSTTAPTTAPTVAPTTAPTVAPTVAPTTTPTTAPTVAPTTAPQNYGPVVNKLSYDPAIYSRRGYDESIKATAENIVSSILSTNMSKVERIRAIHDYLVKNVVYDQATADKIEQGIVNEEVPSLTAYGALVNGLAVCEGYSEAFLLLCWTAGFESRLVEGTGNGGGHEWNVVNIDGKWYQIDVTWGDPKYNGVHPPKGSTENLQYDYFLITTSDMCNKGHTISNYHNSEVVSCTSTDYYEYAKQCTFDVKLGGVPYVIISNYQQADSAITSYYNQKIKKFAFIYPEGSLDYNELMSRAVYGTVNNMQANNISGTVNGGITYMTSIGYGIAIVTLTY